MALLHYYCQLLQIGYAVRSRGVQSMVVKNVDFGIKIIKKHVYTSIKTLIT